MAIQVPQIFKKTKNQSRAERRKETLMRMTKTEIKRCRDTFLDGCPFDRSTYLEIIDIGILFSDFKLIPFKSKLLELLFKEGLSLTSRKFLPSRLLSDYVIEIKFDDYPSRWVIKVECLFDFWYVAIGPKDSLDF